MPLKVLCAGCPKDEREPAESAVKAALGQAAGSWTVSLVKIGRQWSVTVDGPDVKHKTVMVPDGGIRQAIQEIVPAAAVPAPARVAAAPPPTPAPRTPVPAPAAAAAMPRAPLPPKTSGPARAPAPRPAPAPPASARPVAASRRPGEQRDRYECQHCNGAFVVTYEAGGPGPQETVAVACPHCWKNNHVMVADEAALSRDYRADKA